MSIILNKVTYLTVPLLIGLVLFISYRLPISLMLKQLDLFVYYPLFNAIIALISITIISNIRNDKPNFLQYYIAALLGLLFPWLAYMYKSEIYELFSSVIAFTYLYKALISGTKMEATIGDSIPTSLFCKDKDDDSTNVGVSSTASGGSGDNNGGSRGSGNWTNWKNGNIKDQDGSIFIPPQIRANGIPLDPDRYTAFGKALAEYLESPRWKAKPLPEAAFSDGEWNWMKLRIMHDHYKTVNRVPGPNRPETLFDKYIKSKSFYNTKELRDCFRNS